MFLRKYWIPLSVCLVVVVSVGLYLLATQPPPAPIKIYKPVEPLATPTQAPTTQTPVGEKTEQGGHWHGDEWHAEPHTTPAVVSSETDSGFTAEGNGAAGTESIFSQMPDGYPLDLPSRDEIRAMPKEDLMPLADAAFEIAAQLFPEISKRLYTHHRLFSSLTGKYGKGKMPAEKSEILNAQIREINELTAEYRRYISAGQALSSEPIRRWVIERATNPRPWGLGVNPDSLPADYFD